MGEPYSSLKEDTTYWWKVTAFDTHVSSRTSTIWSFRVDSENQAPYGFNLSSPTPYQIYPSTFPVFSWEKKEPPDPDPWDKVKYVVRYSSTDPTLSVSFSSSDYRVDINTYTPTVALTENATYWWRVIALDYNPDRSEWAILRGSQTLSSITTFYVNASSEAPDSFFDLISPLNGSILPSQTTTFQWREAIDPDPGAGIVTYTFELSLNNFISVGYSSSNLTTTSFSYPQELSNDNTTHYWRVIAEDFTGMKSTSSIWTLRVDFTNTPPSAPLLSSPENYQIVYTSYPIFSWQASSSGDPWDIVKYKIEYSTYADFSFSVSSAGISNLNYSAESALKENAAYYWRVTAVDYWDYPNLNVYEQRSTGTVSCPWIFYVNASSEAPGGFNLLSPENGYHFPVAKASKRPAFDWDDAIDPDPFAAVSYEIRYSTHPDFSFSVSSAGITVSSYSVKSALTENATYYWVVGAVNGTDLWTYSTTYYFYIPVIDRPKELTGVKGEWPTINQFKLSWNPVTKNDNETTLDDLAGYNIYRSTDLITVYKVSLSTTAVDTSWIDTGIDDKTYYYLVRAVDTSGIESKDSAIVNSRLEVIWQDEKREVLITLPEEVNQVFYKESEKNPYGSDLKVTIAEKSAEKIGHVLSAYEFKILKATTNEQISNFSFSQPVKVEFSYAGSVLSPGLAETDRAVFRHNGVEYINLGGKVNPEAKVISIKSKNVGRYRVQEVIRATEFGRPKCVPTKIFTPNGDDPTENGVSQGNDIFKIRCDNPKQSTIVSGEVYDITGAFVVELKVTQDPSDTWITVLTWDGKDKDNNLCRDGVYIYQIKSEGKTINGTVILAK